MDTASRTSLRNRLQRVIGVVVALGMVAAGASGALASGLPGVAGNQQSLSPSYASACEAQIAQAVQNRQSASAPLAGFTLLRSDAGRFELWRPTGWSVSCIDPAAIVLTPDGQNQGARFFIEVKDAPNVIPIDDIKWRTEQFDNFVHALPNSQVEWQGRWSSGNVTGFEARYTFHYDGDSPILLWARLLYVGTQQYWLVAEAPSTAEFDSLELTFLAMMYTFRTDD